jgi:hypothetical protein
MSTFRMTLTDPKDLSTFSILTPAMKSLRSQAGTAAETATPNRSGAPRGGPTWIASQEHAPPWRINATPPFAGASGLYGKRVRGLEGPSEGVLSKDVHRPVHNANEAQAIRPHQEHGVIAAQAPHPHADARVFSQVNRKRRLHPVLGPSTPSVDDHAFAAVLRDSKCLRKVGREDSDRIDPGSAPELSRRVRPPELDVGRSVPPQIVEQDRAALNALRRAKGEADRLDRLTAGVGQTPSQNCLRAGQKSDRFAVERRKGVVWVIDQRTHCQYDDAGVALIGDDAGPHGFSGVKERRRHEIVGPYARAFRRRECRRQKRFWLVFKPHVAHSQGPAVLEPDVHKVEARVAGGWHEALHAAGQGKMELRPTLGGDERR